MFKVLKNFQKTTSPYKGLIVKKTCRFDYFGYAVNLEFKFEFNFDVEGGQNRKKSQNLIMA